MVATAAAVGSSVLTVSHPATGAAPASRKHVAPPPLTVLTSEGYGAAVVRAFVHATGTRVKLDTATTASLVKQVDRTRRDPTWGVLWVVGATPFASLDRSRQLVRGLRPKASWNSLAAPLTPKDRSFLPTAALLGGALVYTAKVVADPPTSWQQLLARRWRGEIGMPNPSESGPSYPFVAGMFQYLGGTKSLANGERYFTALKANELRVQTSDSETLDSLKNGTIQLALVSSSSAVGLAVADPAIRVHYLSPLTVVPSDIGVDAKAPKAVQAEAKAFVNFVLSPAGQQVMLTATPTDGSYYYAVVNQVSQSDDVAAITTIKHQFLTPFEWGGSRQRDVTAWFEAHIVG